MTRVLIPINRSSNCKLAVKQAIAEFMNNTSLEIHLVNVQPSLGAYVSRYLSRKSREDFHRDEAMKAMKPCIDQLDKVGVPHSVHIEVGDSAKRIVHLAEKLKCDLILMATARKNSLTRLVEQSVTNQVIELTHVPVEVISGEAVSPWERYGIPAALAGGAAAALFAVAD